MAEFRTRFGVGDTVYIRDPDRLDPEPVVITDVRIHHSSSMRDPISVTYRGLTDAKQKDFPEADLCTFAEAREFYYDRHPDRIETIQELTDSREGADDHPG
jgi:hypothetical protein